jgi:uncharacterized protein (TIGR04255 family)
MRSDFPHLERAPIREAVLDIKAEPRDGIAVEDLAAFVELVKAEFPDASQLQTLHAEFDVQGQPPSIRSSSAHARGTICWNASKTRAVQARRDGFTVNHVQSYESWDVLREQAQRLWLQYVGIAQPKKVTRCALRYINRLELPVLVDISANLLTRPEVGPRLPQVVEDFFMRVVVPFADGRKASVTQASEPIEAGASTRGLILDIDAFSSTVFQCADDAMWLEFDRLRVIKNTCFFESLTPAMWRAYQ